MGRLRNIAALFKREFTVYRRVLDHPRTPRISRWLLWLAVGYVLMPFDLIPDWLPVVGQLDDLVIVPLLVGLAMTQVPQDVVDECRREVCGT